MYGDQFLGLFGPERCIVFYILWPSKGILLLRGVARASFSPVFFLKMANPMQLLIMAELRHTITAWSTLANAFTVIGMLNGLVVAELQPGVIKNEHLKKPVLN